LNDGPPGAPGSEGALAEERLRQAEGELRGALDRMRIAEDRARELEAQLIAQTKLTGGRSAETPGDLPQAGAEGEADLLARLAERSKPAEGN
jgi:hypothetical protein